MPGPIEPSTQRGRPSEAVKESAASRAIRAPASDSSSILSAIPYSASAAWFAPKVLVSTQSTPTAKYASCTEATMSGRVTLRISLQPSNCRKSSSEGSAACNIVPIAPSATTTRDANASRRASARGFFDGPAEADADDEDTVTDGYGKAAMGGSLGCDGCRLCAFHVEGHPARVSVGVPRVGGVPRSGRSGPDGYHDIVMIR